IKETIVETIHFLEASVPSTIELKKFIDPDCYPVMGNKTQIHQVLINLCNNAVQSMEDFGGTLSLTVRNKTLEKELISKDSAIPPGNYVCLVISDTGHGIPEDIIDHVFDPFYTTKSVDKGSGMGLAVVHGIMKAHNGIIRIYSTINQGTTCECYFPAILAPESKTDPDRKEDLQYGTETILLVDDETALVQTGQRMLERLGYKVFAHTNPKTALDFFQASYQKIDLVITDMTMPQMRGDQLIRKLLTINPEIKTIICTGYSSKIDEKTAREIGSGGFILKPMKLSTLSRTVRKILDN
ncbi:MAG: response regulator, partial [Proteobacteria bacterium]|nr:response regulator [Pseudomonadota bacterium]